MFDYVSVPGRWQTPGRTLSPSTRATAARQLLEGVAAIQAAPQGRHRLDRCVQLHPQSRLPGHVPGGRVDVKAQVPAEATVRTVDLTVERAEGKWLVSDAAQQADE